MTGGPQAGKQHTLAQWGLLAFPGTVHPQSLSPQGGCRTSCSLFHCLQSESSVVTACEKRHAVLKVGYQTGVLGREREGRGARDEFFLSSRVLE